MRAMRERGWTGAVIGLALVVLGIVTWKLTRPAGVRREVHAAPIRLDPGAFRSQQAARIRRAKQLAVRPAADAREPVPPPDGATKKWPLQGTGPIPNWGQNLTKPCILGPGELCATLAGLIERCDGGDADDCLAVGELLVDEPPRPLIAYVFFTQACRIGDAAGCERLDAMTSEVPCEQDPFACAWRGYRARDPALLDQACSLGVGDACSRMMGLTAGDVARSRTYLERACQLGSPLACQELGRRLQPDCTPDAEHPCYPPDPARAEAARAIACSAGLEAVCP